MFKNVVAIAGLFAALVPVWVSFLRTSRLKHLLGAHVAALGLVKPPSLRRGYERYVSDLAYELLARTAVPSPWRSTVLLSVIYVVGIFASVGKTFDDANRAVGKGSTPGWTVVLTDSGFLTFSLLTTALFVGLYNCLVQTLLASSRAHYIHATRPGTDAFRRFVRTAKLYVVAQMAPFVGIAAAWLFGVDTFRESMNDVSEDLLGPHTSWVLALGSLGVACGIWTIEYLPLSPMLTKSPMRRRMREATLRSRAPVALVVDTDARLHAQSFLDELQRKALPWWHVSNDDSGPNDDSYFSGQEGK